MDVDVPAAVLEKFGLNTKRQGKEWHSPCPECGGHDRMIWFERGNGWCRQCDFKVWLDGNNKKMDLAERAAYLAQCIAREKQIEQHKLETWQEGFKTGYLWGWHDAMTEQHRAWWHAQGIADDVIDGYVLGYCPNKTIKTDEGTYTLGAYTIPILDPETKTLVNIQYRLENPPTGIGKYRQETGIPARNFYAGYAPGQDCFIVEGAKKALVLFQMLDRTITVIGIPGITPRSELIDEISKFRRKWFLPDPDVQDKAIRRFSERLTNLRLVRLPVKPDDAIVRYGLRRGDLRRYCQEGRLVA